MSVNLTPNPNVVGPQGLQGLTGTTGAQGTAGAQGTSGSSYLAPTIGSTLISSGATVTSLSGLSDISTSGTNTFGSLTDYQTLDIMGCW